MPLNIRDHAILESASARLGELISSCRRLGPVYVIDPALAADVTRKAKGLSTSLGKLCAAADDPGDRAGRAGAREVHAGAAALPGASPL